MKIFQLAINKFKRNFYLRMVIIYSTIIIISLFLLLLLFVGFQNKDLQKQQIKDLTNTVTQFQIFSDQYFLEDIYSIVVKEIFQENSYSSGILNEPLAYKYNSNEYSYALNIKKFATSLQERREFIESITIYNREYDTYVSSKSGVLYNISTNKEKYANIVNYGLLTGIEKQKLNQFWIPVIQNNDFYKEKHIVSFVQLMPMFLPTDQYNIAFNINIDLNKVFSGFFSEINTEKDNFKIIDGKNNLIFDTDTNNLLQNNNTAQVTEEITNSDSGYKISKEEKGRVYTIWRSSSLNEWKYIYTSKETNLLGSIFTSMGYILIWYLIITITVVFIALLIGKWLYKPLNNIVNASSKRLSGIVSEGDITTIDKAFLSVNDKLEKLEGIVKKNDVLIFNNIIHDLVNSKIYDIKELNDRLSLLNKECVNNSFYILLIKIDAKNYIDFTHKEKEILRSTIDEMINNYYIEHYKESFKIAILFDYEGYFTCIINLNEQDYEEEINDAKKILKMINNQFTSIFNLALTKPFKELSHFYKHSQDALGYFKYGFIYGNNNIFTEDSIMKYEKNSIELNGKAIHNIEILLKTQKLELLKENLIFLFEQIKLHGYSYLYMYNLSIQIITIISNECMAQNVSDIELSQQKLLESYSQINNLEECLGWFFKVIDRFEENINLRNINMDNTIIQEIIDYIRNNINHQLSLNSVADYFNLSTGHLSRLFKEKTGSNFSDFVSEVKFEKAIQILLTDGKAKVSDIADILGYSNPTYFTKLFKEKYGMTPTQYRRIHK